MPDQLAASGFTSEGTRTHDKLLAGDLPRGMKVVTLTGGLALTRGTLLGEITASEKRKKCLNASADGSQNAESILAVDADASGGDVQALVYLTGEFNPAAMTIDGALTMATVRQQLRAKGIILKGIVDA
jgi:hypothetical protein